MRHSKDHKKLGRTASHRKAMLANLVSSVFENKQVRTTVAKAKEARRMVDRMITHAKKDTVAARRVVFGKLRRRDVVKLLFDEIAPIYATRNGGYTRVLKLGRRQGDGAEMAVLALVGFESVQIERQQVAADMRAERKRRRQQELEKEQPAAPEKEATEES